MSDLDAMGYALALVIAAIAAIAGAAALAAMSEAVLHVACTWLPALEVCP